MKSPDPAPSLDATAHSVALRLAYALHAIGIEVSSVREAVPQIGERGVRVGVLATEDAMTLCDLLRAEALRRSGPPESEAGGRCER